MHPAALRPQPKVLPMTRYLPLALLSVTTALAAPSLTQVDVFTSGQDGYHTFRIPAIETAAGLSRIERISPAQMATMLASVYRGRHGPELMATLPGVPFYGALGFDEVETVHDVLPNGVSVGFVRMARHIDADTHHRSAP